MVCDGVHPITGPYVANMQSTKNDLHIIRSQSAERDRERERMRGTESESERDGQMARERSEESVVWRRAHTRRPYR